MHLLRASCILTKFISPIRILWPENQANNGIFLHGHFCRKYLRPCIYYFKRCVCIKIFNQPSWLMTFVCITIWKIVCAFFEASEHRRNKKNTQLLAKLHYSRGLQREKKNAQMQRTKKTVSVVTWWFVCLAYNFIAPATSNYLSILYIEIFFISTKIELTRPETTSQQYQCYSPMCTCFGVCLIRSTTTTTIVVRNKKLC